MDHIVEAHKEISDQMQSQSHKTFNIEKDPTILIPPNSALHNG